MSETDYQCEVCGKVEREEYRLDIYHRGCRLKAAFLNTVTERGHGFMSLDVSVLAQSIMHSRAVTRDGVEFERWPDGRVQVANKISGWSWWADQELWQAIIAALAVSEEPKSEVST